MHPTYAFFVFALVLVCADVCSGQEVKHLTGASPGNTKKRSVVTQEKGSKRRRLKSSKSGSSGSKTKSSQSKSGKSGKGSGKEDTSDDVIDCGADTLTCALGPNLRFTLYVESDAGKCLERSELDQPLMFLDISPFACIPSLFQTTWT